MKAFTRYPARINLGLLLKIIISTLWLLCIVSAARSQTISDPASRSCVSNSTTFNVNTTLTGTVTYTWQVSSNGGATYTDITSADAGTYSGFTSGTLTIHTVTVSLHGNRYRCRASNGGTTLTSNAATLTVNPTVKAANEIKEVCGGGGATMTAPQSAGFTYRWFESTNSGATWSALTEGGIYQNVTSGDLQITSAAKTMNGNLYRCETTLGTCTLTGGIYTLQVNQPDITAPASSVETCIGATATYEVSASSPLGALTYQWSFNGSALPESAPYSGTTSNRLTITNVTTSLNGSYLLNITDVKGCSVPQTYGLNVRNNVVITSQPKDTTVCALGTPAGFRVGASYATGYQWQTDKGTNGVSWTNVYSVSATPGYLLSLGRVAVDSNGYRYRVIVNGCGGPLTSEVRLLTVRRSGTWFGTQDINWHEPLNWCGGVPNSATDVVVPNWPLIMPSRRSFMPTISDATGTAFFNSIVIENGAKLTISGGTVNNMTGPFDIQGTVAYTASALTASDDRQDVFPADHGSLEINGTGNKVLGSNVGIAHNLVLGGTAKLVTGNHILTMKAGSNPIVTSAFNDAADSWIVTGNGSSGAANTGLGGLRIEQIDAFRGAVLFPVGPTSAAYNPAQLTNAGSADNFTIAVNDQVIPGGLFASGIERTWRVSEAATGGSNVILNLKWHDAEEQSDFERSQSQIIRSNGNYIVQQSLRAAASTNYPWYARQDGSFSSLTLFSVSSNTVALPIQLQSFMVQKAGNASTTINWKTDAQIAVKYFNVQRSNDGSHFTNIAQVNSAAGKTAYSHADNSPGSGTIYYRLQITGEQNEVVYSPIQSVSLASGNLVQLRPASTSGSSTNVYVSLPQQSPVSIYITDITGRIHVRQSLQLNKGDHQLPLWIGALGKGVYYVHVKHANGNEVLTLVKL
jgi:hypothetical protein